jgi:hypothetical protein
MTSSLVYSWFTQSMPRPAHLGEADVVVVVAKLLGLRFGVWFITSKSGASAVIGSPQRSRTSAL